MESLLPYIVNRVIFLKYLSAISEEHLGELSGGHGLFRPGEPRDWEPVWGAVGGRGGGPLVEGELTRDLYKVKLWGFPRVKLNCGSCLLQKKSCHRLSTHGSPSTAQSLASSIGGTGICNFHFSTQQWHVSLVKASLFLFSRPPHESVMVSRQNVSRWCAAPYYSAGSYRRVNTFYSI